MSDISPPCHSGVVLTASSCTFLNSLVPISERSEVRVKVSPSESVRHRLKMSLHYASLLHICCTLNWNVSALIIAGSCQKILFEL